MEKRLDRLEEHAPALTASLEDAADKYARASARWERARGRKAAAEDDGVDDPEIEELMHRIRGR